MKGKLLQEGSRANEHKREQIRNARKRAQT
jgi:hypothetical protein